MPTHGKYGRTPYDPTKFSPRLEDYITGPLRVAQLPPAKGDIDRASNVNSWPMYENDRLGDCTIAGMAHLFGATAVYGGHPEPIFSDTVITQAYSAVSGYNPVTGANDNGANMQDVLKYMYSSGLRDTTGKNHTIAGWAQFGNPVDEVLLAQVLNVFGSVYVGINCPESALTEFDNGQPWTYEPDSPIDGGHAIVLQRRAVGGIGTLRYVTWGAVQKATRGFHRNYAEEAYAVVTVDWLQANGQTIQGLNLQGLLSDLQYV